jgi:hypothetical protein
VVKGITITELLPNELETNENQDFQATENPTDFTPKKEINRKALFGIFLMILMLFFLVKECF